MSKMLTRSIIEQYKSSRLTAGVKPRTINKEIAFLSGMLKWAQENDLCDPLPFLIKGFPAKMIVSPKPRPLNQEQITMIYNEMPHNLKLAFLLMADAGLRHREALGLKRESVEFTQGVIFVTGKGGKERIVPITTDRLMKELELKKDVTGWLTVNSVTEKPYLTIGVQLNEAVKKAGLDKHVYPHLLRHSFGTNATMADFSLSSLQSIMGHSSVNTTGLYQHLAGEYLRNEGRKLNSMVHNVCPHGKLKIQDK